MVTLDGQNKGRMEFPADIQGDSREMAYNIQYLLDVLTGLDGETVTFEIPGHNSFCTRLDCGNGTAALMPVHKKEW